MRLSQPIETVRVPVSSRPIVCGVVGGLQACATSSSVIPRARRTSRMRVIIPCSQPTERTKMVSLCPTVSAIVASPTPNRTSGGEMAKCTDGRLLVERAIDDEDAPKAKSSPRPACPLRHRQSGRIPSRLASFARAWSHERQFDAGERLRADWERAQLAPRITMAWDAAPISGRRGGSWRRVTSAVRRSTPGAAFMRRSMLPGPVFPISCGVWSAPAKECARRKRARLASASGQAGAHPRARPGRGLLSDPLVVANRGPCGRTCGHSNPSRPNAPVIEAFLCSDCRSRMVGSRMLFRALSFPL